MTERTIIASDGTELWVREDPPVPGVAPERLPVLFLHGFSGSSSATTHLSAAVTGSGRRFLAADLRGHGLSGKPQDVESYSLKRFAADVEDVRAGLGLERFHLCGHCLGGMVAASYAEAHPERVASLTLIGTSLQPKRDEQPLSRAAAVMRLPVSVAIRRLFPAGRQVPAHVDYSRFTNMGDVYWRRVAADWSAMTAPVGMLIVETIRRSDLLDSAATIAVPALVVHGGRDTVFRTTAAGRTHDAIPDSRLLVLPKDNHVTLVLDPRSGLFDALLGFAGECDAA